MTPGDTFLARVANAHLAVVVAECKHGNVLFVRLTSDGPGKDQTCRLGRGDHPWITHDSVIHYGDAMRVPNATLDLQLGRQLDAQEPLSQDVLKRIAGGFAVSLYAKPVDADFVAGNCRCTASSSGR